MTLDRSDFRWSPRQAAAGLLALALGACAERQPPPGATAETSAEPVSVSVNWSADGEAPSPGDAAVEKSAVGTIGDNLPFTPTGTKLASIAWRTWIYTDTGPKRTRYGYLRAGAIVDARATGTVKNAGCTGTWYRINPRGFVCIGKGATLDLKHPIVTSSSVRPTRAQGLPYLYAMSNEIAPLLYFRLPSEAEMHQVEGDGIKRHVFNWEQRAKLRGTVELLGEPGEPPDFVMAATKLEKPYGVRQRLHFSVHAGRASNDSGFAIQQVFKHEGRSFGLTTELDIIALDRTRLVRPSEFRGIVLEGEDDLPVAFVDQHFAQRYKRNDRGQLQADGSYHRRQGVKLTGGTHGGEGGFWETSDGAWIAAAGSRILPKRTSWPSFAKANRKWIDISIKRQSLVAYEGQRPVYATLVSTGRGGLGDPDEVLATVRGTFMIHSKDVSSTMDGADDKSDSFNLRDVPFVQYFHKGYALHGTYWHDEFGKLRSHGCVNLSPIDSAWLFEWTDPVVPPGWHSAINKARGTVVYVHA